MNMPKSRGLHAKIPSPKAIFIGFLLVTVKVLNSYDTSKIPAVIDQNRCLHCGRCVETCPKQVIKKRCSHESK